MRARDCSSHIVPQMFFHVLEEKPWLLSILVKYLCTPFLLWSYDCTMKKEKERKKEKNKIDIYEVRFSDSVEG